MARKLLCLLALLSLVLVVAPAAAEEGALTGRKICLDPGHGGADPGAVNAAFGLHEADINLDVAYGLKALLEADGADVVMARTGDTYADNRDRYTFCNSEQATILVSVHTNSTTEPSWDGSMALYFHSDDKDLAQTILGVMYPTLKATAPDQESFRDFGLSKFASGVLLKSDMPAAMMEPLFMSNPGEAALLITTMHEVDDEGVFVVDSSGDPIPNGDCQGCRRAQIAGSIHQGILSYFGSGPINEPPTVSISSPADEDSFDWGELITFTGSASDPEGGNLTDGLAWISSLDGDIGSGGSFSTELSAGAHTITASVTDSGGLSGEASITITVGGGSGGGITLTATGYKIKGKQKVDLEWSGATSIRIDVYRDGALLETTENDSSFTDSIDRVGRGDSYTYQVCESGTFTCSNEATVTF